jgi:NADH dehydrogenase [ubiquinone] 1 alpha subcomplex assembly factor 5
VDLVAHLRVLGETNAVRARRRTLRRDTALASAAAYHAMFGSDSDAGATVPATFQVIYMAGWAPHSNQQQAKRRGTATVSFADLAEHAAGEDVGGGDKPVA